MAKTKKRKMKNDQRKIYMTYYEPRIEDKIHLAFQSATSLNEHIAANKVNTDDPEFRISDKPILNADIIPSLSQLNSLLYAFDEYYGEDFGVREVSACN